MEGLPTIWASGEGLNKHMSANSPIPVCSPPYIALDRINVKPLLRGAYSKRTESPRGLWQTV